MPPRTLPKRPPETRYGSQLGKQDNCRVAVTLSVANHVASLPIAYRLYLPKEWASDSARRDLAGVPEAIGFASKPEIALASDRGRSSSGRAAGVVLMDAGYGTDTGLRTAITALGLRYVAGIQSTTTCGLRRKAPLPPKPSSGRSADHAHPARRGAPVGSGKAIALGLPISAWQRIAWPEGSADRLSSRFARLRVRAAHRDNASPTHPQRRMAVDRVAAAHIRRRTKWQQVRAGERRPIERMGISHRYRLKTFWLPRTSDQKVAETFAGGQPDLSAARARFELLNQVNWRVMESIAAALVYRRPG